jgi:glycosyltransferase involved in cell wall biosynthesis
VTIPPPLFASAPAPDARRRLLLISPAFPPCAEVGALRWQKLAHTAAARGWALDVITGAAAPGERADPAPLQLLPAGVRVWTIPLRPVLVERVRRTVWRSLKALAGPRRTIEASPGGTAGASIGQASDSFFSIALREHRARNHFAAWQQWCREVTALARAIAHEGAPQVVVGSGPPHMTHEAARQAAAALGVPLVIDLRDPWFIDHAEPPDLRGATWQRRTAAYESTGCHAAGLIVTTATASAELLLTRYPELASRIIVAMNGADPEVRRFAAAGEDFIVAHVGNLYGGRDPRLLFRAVHRVLERANAPMPHLRVEFMGGQTYDGVPLEQIAAEEGIAERFTSHAALPRTEALRFMGQAAVLVILPQDWSFSIPAKVFEYMQFDASLLVLSRRTDATSHLLATTTADLVAPDDVERMAELIATRYAEWTAGKRPVALNADGRFDRETQARLLFDRMEQLL